MQIAPPSGGRAPGAPPTAHRIGSARAWSVGLVVAMTLVSFQQITRPDYNAERRAPPSEYLWTVGPGLLLVGFIAYRLWRARVEATAEGLRIVRTTTTDVVPWHRLARFEVRRTPNGGGWRLVARTTDERVTLVASAPGKGERARAKVEALRERLEAERAALGPPQPPAA